jgi:hypothetical protein
MSQQQYTKNKAIVLWGFFSEEECILYGIQFSQVTLRSWSGDALKLTAEDKRVETGHGDSCTWQIVSLWGDVRRPNRHEMGRKNG